MVQSNVPLAVIVIDKKEYRQQWFSEKEVRKLIEEHVQLALLKQSMKL